MIKINYCIVLNHRENIHEFGWQRSPVLNTVLHSAQISRPVLHYQTEERKQKPKRRSDCLIAKHLISFPELAEQEVLIMMPVVGTYSWTEQFHSAAAFSRQAQCGHSSPPASPQPVLSTRHFMNPDKWTQAGHMSVWWRTSG